MEKVRLLKQLIEGSFLLTVHAFEQMQERLISEMDIQYCAASQVYFEFQEEQQTWLLIGKDPKKRELHVVVATYDDVLIVTTFRPKKRNRL